MVAPRGNQIESISNLERDVLEVNLPPNQHLFPKEIQGTPSEPIYDAVRNLVQAAQQQRLTEDQQREAINTIRSDSRKRLRQLVNEIALAGTAAQNPDELLDVLGRPINPQQPSGLSGPGLLEEKKLGEYQFLRQVLDTISPTDIIRNILETVENLEDEFWPQVQEQPSEAVQKIDSLLHKVAEIMIDFPGLSEENQARRLENVLTEARTLKASLHDQIIAFKKSREYQLLTRKSVDPNIDSQLKDLEAALRIIKMLEDSVVTHDWSTIRNIVQQDHILQEQTQRQQAEQQKQQEYEERMKQNTTIQVLIAEGFERDILLWNIEGIHFSDDPTENERLRNEAIERKYRYIESAIVSLLFRFIVEQTPPETLEMPDLGSMNISTASQGNRVQLQVTYDQLIKQLTVNVARTEQSRAQEAITHLEEWKALFSVWSKKFKQMKNETDKRIDMVKTITPEDSFFDPCWLNNPGGPTELARMPEVMVPVHSTQGIEWKPIYEGASSLDILGGHLYEFFINNRYSSGFYANTIQLDLNRILIDPQGRPNAHKAENAPPMWRVKGPDGKMSQLFSPLIFISPGEGNKTLDPPPPGSGLPDFRRTPLLPRTMWAKPDTSQQRMANSREVFNATTRPQEIREENGTLYYGPTREYPVIVPSDVAWRYFAEMLMEVGGFGANSDNQLTLTMEEAFNHIVARIPNIEGKYTAYRIGNPAIAVKYSANPQGASAEIAQFGAYNQSALAVTGPIPYPGIFDSHIIAAPHPETGEFMVGSIGDWVVWLRGQMSRLPWRQVPENFTARLAADREYFFKQLTFLHENKDPITQIQQLNMKEGYIESVNSEMIQSLVSLERWIKVYILGACDADSITIWALMDLLDNFDQLPDTLEQSLSVLLSDQEKQILGQLLQDPEYRRIELPKDKKKWLEKELAERLHGQGHRQGSDRRISVLQHDLNSRCDYFCRVIVKNADTGEVQYWDNKAFQHFQLQPAVLLNQADEYQISDIRSPQNPNGRHYAKWLDPGREAWVEANEFIQAAGNISPEEKNLWNSYIDNWEEHPMPLMVISIGGKRPFNPETGKFERVPVTETPSPQDMISDKIFFDTLGAANARSNIFERMTPAQKLAVLVAFSEEARWNFIRQHFTRVGGVTFTEIVSKIGTHAAQVFGLPADMARNMGLKEFPQAMTLPTKGSMNRILRWLHGRNGARTTSKELMDDQDKRKEVAKIFSLDF